MDIKQLLTRYSDFLETVFFKGKARAVVGIDIGTSSIKAVELAVKAGGFELVNWAVEAIEGSDVKGALERLLKRMNIKEQTPVAAVSGKGTLIRYVEMPRMPVEELRKSFTYEVDKYFPFDPQTIYTDCHIIDTLSKDKKMPVLLVAVKKELVDHRVALFKEAGLELSEVTTNSIAMLNAFASLDNAGASDKARAVLDIGGAVSSLMVLDKANIPSFTRDLFVGGHEISKQMAAKLSISVEEVERLKRDPQERKQEVLQACEAAVESLAGEIRLSMDYIKTEKNAQVAELFLVGGASLLDGIEGLFEKRLNIPVKRWDPIGTLSLGEGVVSKEVQAHASQLGVAVGLALTKI